MEEPWIPILCSIPVEVTSFHAPWVPSSFTQNLGTIKQLMPEVPGFASGVLASTRWIMFEARSWSPEVIKHFWPLILYRPGVSVGKHLVATAPTSEPAPGSVRPMVPPHSPEYILGRKRSFSTSEALCWITVQAPAVRHQNITIPGDAPDCISRIGASQTRGMRPSAERSENWGPRPASQTVL